MRLFLVFFIVLWILLGLGTWDLGLGTGERGAGSREQRAGRALRWNADLLCKYADGADFH